MFDKPLEYRFIQRNKRFYGAKKYRYEYIFKFFIRNKSCRRKIVVEVKQYAGDLFVVDYYATVAAKERDIRNLDSSKYRYKTNVGRSNRIASTIFAILFGLRQNFPEMSFGFQCATMINEASDDANRRFQVYSKIMSFITAAPNSIWHAFAYEENSYIFVIQRRHSIKLQEILIGYGNIFGKVFTEEENNE